MKIKTKINVKDITADKIVKYLGILAIFFMLGMGIMLIFNSSTQESTGITEDLKPTAKPVNNSNIETNNESPIDFSNFITVLIPLFLVVFGINIILKLHRDW
jgi:hypothetical protein